MLMQWAALSDEELQAKTEEFKNDIKLEKA